MRAYIWYCTKSMQKKVDSGNALGVGSLTLTAKYEVYYKFDNTYLATRCCDSYRTHSTGVRQLVGQEIESKQLLIVRSLRVGEQWSAVI